MTVLTNSGDVLPLQRGATLALVGRHAVETVDMGGGSAQVNPPYQASVAEGLTAMLGDDVTVTDGVEVRTRPVPARPDAVTHPETGEPGVQVHVLAADGSVLEERTSTTATTMVGFDDDFDQVPTTVRFRARVTAGGRIQVGVLGAGSWQLRAGDQVLCYDLAVSRSGIGEEVLRPPSETTLVDLGDGDVIEATVSLRGRGTGERPLASAGLFGLIAGPAPRDEEEVMAQAVAAASAADVAVVVVGLTEEQETESVDKHTLRLPGSQDALVTAVAAAARRTVVVVNAATPVLMPWLDQVDAVLWAGLPGQEGGHAVAAALLGEIEPAGRLVTTFPAEDGAGPAWSVTPVDGRLVYAEGPFLGYRGHAAGRAPAPAFWFGAGLGYSTLEYGAVEVTGDGPGPTVSVTVTNTGARSSREVVQVYLRPGDSRQPVRLVGWRPVTAEPGETVTVDVGTEPRMWRTWDADRSAWGQLLPGGELLVARGLGDVRAAVALPEAAQRSPQ